MAIQMKSKPGSAGKSSGSTQSGNVPMSLRPSDQVSEGLLDDMDVLFESMEFTLEGPPNYNAGESVPLFVKAHLVPQDGGDAIDQWWSCGDSSKFQPSDDGKSAVRVKGSGGIGSGTNVAVLFRSIVDAGFPEDRMESNLTCFEGMIAHVKQQAQPKRARLARDNENERPRTILCVEKIVKLPWENKGSGASKGAAASKASSNGSVDVDDLAVETVQAILEKAGSAVEVKKLPAKAFVVLAQPKFKAHKQEILNKLKDEEFLAGAAESGAFDFDGEKVKPAE